MPTDSLASPGSPSGAEAAEYLCDMLEQLVQLCHEFGHDELGAALLAVTQLFEKSLPAGHDDLPTLNGLT